MSQAVNLPKLRIYKGHLNAFYDIAADRMAGLTKAEAAEVLRRCEDWPKQAEALKEAKGKNEALEQKLSYTQSKRQEALNLNQSYAAQIHNWSEQNKDLQAQLQAQAEKLKALTARIKELENALRNVASKLESQVARDPGLPEYYKQILSEAFALLRLSSEKEGAM